MKKTGINSQGSCKATYLLRMVAFTGFFILHACTGKVANVAAIATGASASLSIATTELTGIRVGEVSTTLVTLGGVPPLTFKVTSGSLVPGLTLGADVGNISGRIEKMYESQKYTVGITVTDSTGQSASRVFTGVVKSGADLLTYHSTRIADFMAALSYSYPLVVTGGTPPYQFELSDGAFPEGITLETESGYISGTPAPHTVNQSYSFSIKVTDAKGGTVEGSYIGIVKSSASAEFSIITPTLPAMTAGASFGASIGVIGGSAPFKFTASSGKLPDGLTINSSTGLISGTPDLNTAGKSYNVTIAVSDDKERVTSLTYIGTVNSYSTLLFPTNLPNASPGSFYNINITTLGGEPPYVYSEDSGSLPQGLELNISTGNISGIVEESEAGVERSFTISSMDVNEVVTTQSFKLTTSNFPISVTTTSLENAFEGLVYDNDKVLLAATGGTGPYTFEYMGGLPSGLGLTSSGAFLGSPAAETGDLELGRLYEISVRAIDSKGFRSAPTKMSLMVRIPPVSVTTSSLPEARLGAPYSFKITATGGRKPYKFAVVDGSLPQGLQLVASSGEISGSASSDAACPDNTFKVVATDDLDETSIATDLCIATADGVRIANQEFPPVIIGKDYNATVTGDGGQAPYSFEASNLPDQIVISQSTGKLNGFTGASVGDYKSYLTIYDSGDPQQFQALSFTFRVREELGFSSVSLPRAATGLNYNGNGFQLPVTGGKAPYTYTLISGALPAGMTLSTSGLLTGIPGIKTAAYGGSYNFTVSVRDVDGQQAGPASFTLNVTVPPKILGSRMPIAVVGTPYAYDIQRIGGVNTFASSTDNSSRLTYAVSGLPSGLTFGSKTGRIFGTPDTNEGSPYTITVTLTDQHGFATTKNLTLQVNSIAKTLDLKTARSSDPCAGTSNCNPRANDIAALTNNAQQFLIYARHDVNPRAIQIAKIDPSGRVPNAGAAGNNTTRAHSLTTLQNVFNAATITQLRASDIDGDGFLDVVFLDANAKLLCVMWNPGTVNGFGMPDFLSTNMNCFPVPVGSNTNNFPFSFVVRDDLRPDATNIGKKDVVIAITNGASQGSLFAVLKTNCSTHPRNPLPCNSASRPTIFEGYVSSTISTQPAGSTITLASAAGFENIGGASVGGIYGSAVGSAGTPIATISSKSGNTLTLSQAPNTTLSAVGTTVTTLTAAIYTTAAYASGATTITGLSAATIGNIRLGQQVSGTGVQAQTVVTAINTSTNTITIFPATNAANASGGVTIFGPTVHIPRLLTQGSSQMAFAYYLSTGWFVGSKPNISNLASSAVATAVDECPGIVVSGAQQTNTGNGFLYVARQTYSSTTNQCQGDFQTHSLTDEWLASGGTPSMGQVAAEDFNGDGRTDVAVTVSNAGANANSANVRVYLTNFATAFSGGFSINPQLQSRTASSTITTGASFITPYCLNGAATCTFPSLMVTCGGNATYGCLSIIPNQCTTAGCSTPFEASTPTKRIDYPAPPTWTQTGGQSSSIQDFIMKPIVSTSFVTPTGDMVINQNVVTVSSTAGIQVGQPVYNSANYTYGSGVPTYAYVTAVGANSITMNQNATGSGSVKLFIPQAPTQNDVAIVGTDATSSSTNNYFLVYARNGNSQTDPLKGATTLDSYPNAFLQNAEIGTTRVLDADGDGRMDLFAYAPGQGFVGAYMGSSGSPNKGISSWPDPSYLSSPNAGGCPNGTTFCHPDPVFNSMGVQQGFPTGEQFEDATMDMADVNNDGIADIAAVGYTSRGIAVAFGATSGDVEQPVLYPIGTNADYRPRSVKMADLDQDGFTDMVAIGSNLSVTGTTGFAVWYKNNGDGTFQTPQFINQILSTTATCSDPSPRSVTAFDIDLDGRPEIAVMCYTSQSVWVSRRNTNGVWVLQSGSSVNSLNAGANGWSMKWGRLTTASASGVDLVVTGLDMTSTVRAITGITLSNITADGSFSLVGSPGNYLTLNARPSGVDIADFNGDGLGDYVVGLNRTVATGQNGNTYMTCLSNSGVGASCTQLRWGNEGATTTSVTAADTNDDGLPELFVGFHGQGRLIYRTLAAIFNLSQ